MDYDSCAEKCTELEEKAIAFIGKYDKLFDEINGQVSDFMYGRGGQLLHRGYYCPSPISDVIIGNVTRGRLLKKNTTSASVDYKYGFDSNKRLRIIFDIKKKQNEFVFYDNSVELSVVYDRDNEVSMISECTYASGRITSYANLLYGEYARRVYSLKCEEYYYSSERLSRADTYTFYPQLSPTVARLVHHDSLFLHEAYYFEHDEDGYLSSYYSSDLNGDKDEILEGPWKVKASIKRKI